MNRQHIFFWGLLLTTSLFLKSGNAAEYFVNLRGNDGNDGLSHEKTFCTISKGLKALRPGDTLTIGPGEYRESIEWAFPGEQDKQTVVRA